MVIVILSVAIIVAYQSKVGEERSERERERGERQRKRERGKESRGERDEREGGGRESVKAVGRPLLVMRAVGRPLVLDVRCSCVVHVAR